MIFSSLKQKILFTFKVEDIFWPFERLGTILYLCRKGYFNEKNVSEIILFGYEKHLKYVKNEDTFTIVFYLRPVRLDFAEN